MSRAVLLIAHGSRLDQANREAIEMASRIESQAGCRVHACFLEIATPTIEVAFEKAVEEGATEIVAVPFLLSAGAHVTRDIPRILG